MGADARAGRHSLCTVVDTFATGFAVDCAIF